MALIAAFFSAGLVLTIIVIMLAWEKEISGNIVLEQRKEEVAGEVQRIRIPGLGMLDYQRLFEVVSEPGESLDAFALRISPRLRDFSDESEFEACGVIATDGQGGYGIVVGTNRSHIACANFFLSRLPAGMKATEQTIHSHGVDLSLIHI